MCNDHLGGGKGGKEREYSLSTWCPFSLRTHSHRFPSFPKKRFYNRNNLVHDILFSCDEQFLKYNVMNRCVPKGQN